MSASCQGRLHGTDENPDVGRPRPAHRGRPGQASAGPGARNRCTAATGPQTAYGSFSFTPDVPGSYTVVVTPLGATTGAITWTVVASAPVVQSIKAYLNTDTTTATSADASSLSYTAASSVTAKGALVVQQYSTTDTTTVATTAISQAVTVTISKGLVSKTNDYFAGAKSVTTAAAGSTAGRSEYYVFANGEVGSATLTVTVGALTSTKTITFQGVAASMTAALTTGQNTWIAPTGTANCLRSFSYNNCCYCCCDKQHTSNNHWCCCRYFCNHNC